MAKKPRIRSGFNLGGEAAEIDGLLEDAFIESGDYLTIASRNDHKSLLIGRTGAGKSAVLQRLTEDQLEHCIRINPENLSLPYITNLQAIRYLDSLEVNLDIFWQALWRHVLLVEIIKHRYQVHSPEVKSNVFETLRNKLKNDRTKRAALEYLNEFEGKFWCETDERVREITDKFAERLSGAAGLNATVAGVGAKTSLEGATETSQESKTEQAFRFQRVVDETQLARLNKMIDVLDDDILDSSHHYTYVVIDDLDKQWVDERVANDLIRCLFSTVYSLQHVRHLKIIVALRANIFQELDFGRRGAGQEEKIRALVLEMSWSKRELIELINERVRIVSGRMGSGVNTMSELLPNTNATMGKPIDYLIDRTLLRPRDALAFANECLKVAAGKDRLSWPDVRRAERSYSAGRVLALQDEWWGTYPGITSVLDVFRRSPARMNEAEMRERLDEVALLVSDVSFPGTSWLAEMTSGLWSSGSLEFATLYKPLLSILYRVGLIGVSPHGRAAPLFFADDPLYVEQASNLRGEHFYYIHRTFHRGLEVLEAGDRGIVPV